MRILALWKPQYPISTLKASPFSELFLNQSNFFFLSFNTPVLWLPFFLEQDEEMTTTRESGTWLGTHLITQEQLITKQSTLGINLFANSLPHSNQNQITCFCKTILLPRHSKRITESKVSSTANNFNKLFIVVSVLCLFF